MKRLTITNDEYQKLDAVSNSQLKLMKNNPADLIWLRDAPVNLSGKSYADIGTAFHSMCLEPEKFDQSTLISDFKGRNTKGFQSDITENPDKTVLTVEEYETLKFMHASAMAHPSFRSLINTESHRESSIIVKCPNFEVDLKIRPDIDIEGELIANLKTTANLDDWRVDLGKHWIHPLYKFGYGHGAAYELYVSSIFYGKDIDVCYFPVVQKTPSLGRYPVAVFRITKQELIEYGFWDEMLNNLKEYADRLKRDDWLCLESFTPPNFGESIEFEG